uniref:Uncharacterized protein n=1 Tax=Sus scrofa TaxID=9823 RepID=A0A8D1E0M3_PIG
VLRRYSSLGFRTGLPFKLSAHQQRGSREGFFISDLMSPLTSSTSLSKTTWMDLEIITPSEVRQKMKSEVSEIEGKVPVRLDQKLYPTKQRK